MDLKDALAETRAPSEQEVASGDFLFCYLQCCGIYRRFINSEEWERVAFEDVPPAVCVAIFGG